MIYTFLEPEPRRVVAAGFPVSMARPKTLALVRIPRFHPSLQEWAWSFDHVVNFLIDTGADMTSIDLVDAVDLFEPRRFAEITRVEPASGIGDQEVLYAVEPAEMYLLHEDGRATLIHLDLSIQRPTDEMIQNNEIEEASLSYGQALLGRDVLTQLKLDVDYRNPDPYVKLWPKGTDVIDLTSLPRGALASPGSAPPRRRRPPRSSS